jgi:hypothetical protein
MQHATYMSGADRQVMHYKGTSCRQHKLQVSGEAVQVPTIDCRYHWLVPTVGPQTEEVMNTQTCASDRSPDIQLTQLAVVLPTELLLIIH